MKEKMKEIVICIPTYKNRYSNLLNYVNTLSDKYDVCVVFSTYDEKLPEYDTNYQWNDKIIKLYTDAPTIGAKHQFIIDEMYKRGYKYVFQIDDDIKPIA